MRDTAKRDFSVSYDATKGCYYNNSLLLATFCYWMAGFDLFALERIDTLAAGT